MVMLHVLLKKLPYHISNLGVKSHQKVPRAIVNGISQGQVSFSHHM